MPKHTTNYNDTFIEVAEDCPAMKGIVPPLKDPPTIANIQFDLLHTQPYAFTSDDVLFRAYAQKNEIPQSAWKEARERFFSKGQACMRASPLTKRLGWGVHSDAEGRIALFPLGSKEYTGFVKDDTVRKVKAMRNSRGGSQPCAPDPSSVNWMLIWIWSPRIVSRFWRMSFIPQLRHARTSPPIFATVSPPSRRTGPAPGATPSYDRWCRVYS